MALLRPAEALPVAGAAVVAVAGVLGGAFYPGEQLGVGVALAAVLAFFGIAIRPTDLDREEIVLLALVVTGGVSAAVAGSSPLVAKQVVTGWLVAWCLWLGSRRATPRAVTMAAGVVTWGALLVSVGVVLRALGGGGLRVGGFFDNPNLAAALLVVSIPVADQAFAGRSRWRFLVAAVLAEGVVVTGSRAGLLALVVVIVLLLPPGRLRVVALLTGASLVTAILAWRFVSQPEVLAWFRPSIWFAVVRLWWSQPVLGVGPGGLADAAGAVRLIHADHVGHYPYLITYAESTPLGLLVQAGTIGGVLAAVGAGLWAVRASRDGVLAGRRIHAGLAAVAVVAAFHDMTTLYVVLWWWGVALGLLESANRVRNEPRPQTVSRNIGQGAMRAMILAFLVLWGLVQPAWAWWLWRNGPPSEELVDAAVVAEPWFDRPLEWRVRQLLGEEAWSWNQAGEALARSERAVRVHPEASRLWLILGQVHARVTTDLGSWPDSVANARRAFARATELEPHLPWAWLEWARLERGLGNLDRAAELVRRSVSEEPNCVRGWLFLARVELDRGQVEQVRRALAEVDRALRLRQRRGLTNYERELLEAPKWQLREIVEAVR